MPEVGRVIAFFRIPVVAVIKIARGQLAVGDRIWIKGHTTDAKLAVASMQIDHQPIQTARRGDEVGVKVSRRARRGDRVYRLPA
ncbi:MAG: translation elongation factor-like protein [Candidatus Omnitrophica bacterium]|nr:translation elongation factor-like protein [Candidatus Omnitrophota bacterium]